MNKTQAPPSPIIPQKSDDPRWPETREERCANYIRSANWYRLFWQLRAINQAARYAREDEQRNAGRRRSR